MKCPFCGKQLKPGAAKECETIVDHVMTPNLESYPMRQTFVCECTNVFWDEYGDDYGTIGAHPAIGSASHKHHARLSIAAKIRPFCKFAEYPYDRAYQIAGFIANLILK